MSARGVGGVEHAAAAKARPEAAQVADGARAQVGRPLVDEEGEGAPPLVERRRALALEQLARTPTAAPGRRAPP